MLHAIHSAGLGMDPYVVYRTRGIYAWTDEGVTPPELAGASVRRRLVFGGDPAVPQATQPHNLYHPTYPRDERQCSACHVAGFDTVPDQSVAVATTIDAGVCESNCGTTRSVEEPARRYAAGRIGGRMHELPLDDRDQGSCVQRKLDPADLPERASDHSRSEVS